MKFNIKSLFCILCFAFSVNALAWAPVYNNAYFNASGPSFSINFEHRGEPNLCIGGQECGQNAKIIISYPAPGCSFCSQTYVQKLTVYAHDNVGSSTKAHLQLWSGDGSFNGQFDSLVQELDVKSGGSFLTFNVNRYVSKLYLKSVGENSSVIGGDETVITEIKTY